MKYLLLVFLILCNLLVSAQDQNDINIEDLRTPTSPGFILLDQAPTTVEKPTTAKTFALNLFNAINENNGIPKNFSMEVAPAWFLRDLPLNAYIFYGINKQESGGKPVYKQNIFSQARWASFSFAAVTRDTTDNTAPGSNIALGARTTLLSLHTRKNIAKIVARDSIITQFVKNILGVATNDTLSDAEKKDSISSINRAMTPHEDTLRSLLANKMFVLDGALAYNWAFDSLNYESGRFGRFGAWLSGGFSFPLYSNQGKVNRGYINAILLARYIIDNNTYKTETKTYQKQDVYDYGGRLGYEKGALSFSYELVYRVNGSDKEKNTFRHGALIQYKVRDNLYLSGTIGRNFGELNNLIALFGINWGFGKEKLTRGD